MAASRHRLDRLLSILLGINRRAVKPLLAQRRVLVDGIPAVDGAQLVDEFSVVDVDGEVLQSKQPVHIMLHKPVGVLSATADPVHRTAIDLVDHPQRHDLHIAGRLDRQSSGLLLLTNDGRWSRALMAPENHVEKVYQVHLAKPLTPDYIEAFAVGMHFPFENITTLPARLEILSERVALVTLVEGRYHQIKRMFGRFRNPVLGLHRIAIGPLHLDSLLEPAQWQELSAIAAAGAVSAH